MSQRYSVHEAHVTNKAIDTGNAFSAAGSAVKASLESSSFVGQQHDIVSVANTGVIAGFWINN